MNFELPLQLKPTCRCLRHKMMYCDPRQDRPGFIDANSDTRVFFCTKSQDSLGPDNVAAHPADCKPGRGCYSDHDSM
ncbi:MAG: hypothetical protein AB7G11_07985 [Phycisphaerales bacterium]